MIPLHMKCQLPPILFLLLICSALLQCVSASHEYDAYDDSLFSVPEVPAIIGEDAVVTCYKLAMYTGYNSEAGTYNCRSAASDNTTCRITFYLNGAEVDDSNAKYEVFHSTTEREDTYCKFSDYSFDTVLLDGGYKSDPCFYSTLTIKNVASQDLGGYECRWPRAGDDYPALSTTVDLYDASDDSVAITESLIYQSKGYNFVQFVYTSTEGAKGMKVQWGDNGKTYTDPSDISEIDEYMAPKEINSTYISNGFVHEAYFYMSEHHWLDKDLIIYCGDYTATLNAPYHSRSYYDSWSHAILMISLIIVVVIVIVVMLVVTSVLASVRANVCSCCQRQQVHNRLN